MLARALSVASGVCIDGATAAAASSATMSAMSARARARYVATHAAAAPAGGGAATASEVGCALCIRAPGEEKEAGDSISYAAAAVLTERRENARRNGDGAAVAAADVGSDSQRSSGFAASAEPSTKSRCSPSSTV